MHSNPSHRNFRLFLSNHSPHRTSAGLSTIPVFLILSMALSQLRIPVGLVSMARGTITNITNTIFNIAYIYHNRVTIAIILDRPI